MSIEKDDFLPCPFCGSHNLSIELRGVWKDNDCFCDNCGGCIRCADSPQELLDLWNRRSEPRTCETCAGRFPGCKELIPSDGICGIWTPSFPQSADVETVRDKIVKLVREVVIMWDHGGCGPLHPYSIHGSRFRESIAALDRIAGKGE